MECIEEHDGNAIIFCLDQEKALNHIENSCPFKVLEIYKFLSNFIYFLKYYIKDKCALPQCFCMLFSKPF